MERYSGLALDNVTVLFGRFWTFLYHLYFKFALILDWFQIIRFLGGVIRFCGLATGVQGGRPWLASQSDLSVYNKNPKVFIERLEV